MGDPLQGRFALKAASSSFRELAHVRIGDHVLIGVNPNLGFEAKLNWPDGLLLLGNGPNGAGRALLRQIKDLRWVARRFDRIVIGSGDGVFASVAHRFREFGLPVVVVSREHSLSYRLAAAADGISLMPEIQPLEVVA
ncbi:NYN domain-containing protein [Gemmatimonadota bacterium]